MSNEDNIQADSTPAPSDGSEYKQDNIQAEEKPAVEDTASKIGYQTKDQFIANGGKEENYQSPEIFMALKGPLNKIKSQRKHYDNETKRMQAEFNEQMQSMQTYHKAQLESQKSDLVARREQAINENDQEGIRAAQTQIDNLPDPMPAVQPAAPQISEDLQNWNSDSRNTAWYGKNEAKTDFANKKFGGYRQQGHDDATCIRLMEQDLSTAFPNVNNNAVNAPPIEGGTKPGSRGSSSKASMQNLTQEEQRTWQLMGQSSWGGDEKAFLKAVQTTRDFDNG